MNIFYVDSDVRKISEYLCDKHIVKMPTESAQMLSTAHRVLDGTPGIFTAPNGKKKKALLLHGEQVEFTPDSKLVIQNAKCYKATHANHPANVWTRSNRANYNWHVLLLKTMLTEYEARYKRQGAVRKILDFLSTAPKNIGDGEWSEPPITMPDKFKTDSVIESYREFYRGDKRRFAKWKNGNVPFWFII